MRTKAVLNRSRFSVITHVVFIIHLPVQVANSTFVGFQGDPWVSCHIDQLRPSDKNAFTLEVAQGVSVSQLFYGGLEYAGPERQTSEISSNMEDLAFERLSSVEEGLEEAIFEGNKEIRENIHLREQLGQKEDRLKIVDIEGETDSNESNSSTGVANLEERLESSGSDKVHEDESFYGPPKLPSLSSASIGTKAFSDVHTQCVRLNSCIQAAVSRLQDTTLSKQRAAERVRLLIQVIPSNPIFPLGETVLSVHNFTEGQGNLWWIPELFNSN